MTWTRSIITLVTFVILAGAGLFYQDRANKHDLAVKTTAPAVAVQAPAVAPSINGDVLDMARKAEEEAIKDKKRSFFFKGGGAEFNLGAGCNTCAQAPAVAAVTSTPIVTSAPPKAKPVVIYRDRLAPRNSSVSYRRSAQSEPVRRVEPRIVQAPREARNFTYARPRGCPSGSTYTPVKMEGLRMLPNPGCHFSSHSACTVYAGQIGGSCDHCNDRNWAYKPWVVRVSF